jgi:hypothetical protein
VLLPLEFVTDAVVATPEITTLSESRTVNVHVELVVPLALMFSFGVQSNEEFPA